MNLPLPDYYLTWLHTKPNLEYAEYAACVWHIYSLVQLNQEIDFDDERSPCWQQLQSVAAILREVLEQDFTECGAGKFSLERLANCVVIGDKNSDLLFCDVHDHTSLWCIYKDGGEVEQIAGDLTLLVKQAQLRTVG